MNALDEGGRSPLQLAFARLRLIEEDEVAHSTAKKFKTVVMEVVKMLQIYLSKVGHVMNERENLDSLYNKLEQTTSIEQVNIAIVEICRVHVLCTVIRVFPLGLSRFSTSSKGRSYLSTFRLQVPL